jgi:hypothetical protein
VASRADRIDETYQRKASEEQKIKGEYDMKKSLFAVMLLSMALVATPAHANYICSGAINYLGLSSNGTVVVGGPGGIPDVNLCQLGATTSNGFTPDACKAAYSTLLAAKLGQQSVSIYFSDNLTCTTQPAWGPFVSVYFISTP